MLSIFPLTGWLTFVFVLGLIVLLVSALSTMKRSIIVGIILAIMVFFSMFFYYHKTASGRRSLISSSSEFTNGLDRSINVYTADGELMAHYEGRIDLQENDGGYLMFDFGGKRYVYYNCFVECIADISEVLK